MDEGDEFGDLYSDVLQPFQPPAVLSPPSPPLHHLNLRSQYQDAAEANSASTARVSDDDASKLSATLSQDATRQAIGDGGGDDTDMNFDIEEPDAVSTPLIPGLFVTASEAEALPVLATDRGVVQDTAIIEQVGDGGYGGQGEGDDWDSDSEDDFQIVLNDSSRNAISGADRRSKMGDNEDDDDDDNELPLIIVNDASLNQPMEKNLWGDGNDGGETGKGSGPGGEAGKGSGPGGAAGLPKTVHNSNVYHQFHSPFKVSVNATLLSLISLLNGRDSCRGPVLVFLISKCIPLYLYLNPNKNAEYVNQRYLRLLLDFMCLVIKLRLEREIKTSLLYVAILCHHQLHCSGVIIK